MKTKLFTFFTFSILALNSAVIALADVKTRSVADTSGMVAMLPDSDAVAVIDIKRFLSSALPQILSANPSMLGEVNKFLDEAKAKSGIDFRQFEHVAAGVTVIKTGEKDFDFDAVVIARGQINAGALLAAAKIAANGKYREEKAGERTVFIFEPAQAAQQNLPAGQAKTAGSVSKALGGKKELAATAIDGGTIIFGSVDRVKLALAGTSRLSPEISGLLNKTAAPVMSFAGRLPGGMGTFLPLQNDELGKQVESIKYLYGSMDVTAAGTAINATARTAQPEAATGLKDSLEGLQMLGKALLGGAKGDDKQVYARLVENVKFSARGNDVSMDLTVAQPDVNFLIGLLATKK